jgi:hypothetical protein
MLGDRVLQHERQRERLVMDPIFGLICACVAIAAFAGAYSL